MRLMVKHYVVVAHADPVCKARSSVQTRNIAELLEDENPCPRCLEWVVEQGQLASQRLEHMRSSTHEE